jgi:1-pyrroline-5-carboxylate dehydrogenase
VKLGVPSEDPSTFMGAVIDRRPSTRFASTSMWARTGKVVLGGDAPQDGKATSFRRRSSPIDPKARIAQEEIFGPVLAFIRAKNYEDALRIANTEYGLTGAVYSKDLSG